MVIPFSSISFSGRRTVSTRRPPPWTTAAFMELPPISKPTLILAM